MSLQHLKYFAIAVADRLMPSHRNQYRGDYRSWENAEAACNEGYAQQSILEKVKKSTLDVVQGRAFFERDSVTFQREEFNWPLLTVLWRMAKQSASPFAVMDFGGALGSTYFQNRKLLREIDGLQWCVVEQEHFSACGREMFETEKLHFYSSLSECIAKENVKVALFSSVLAYLSDPWQVLSEVAQAGIESVVIDQTQVLDCGTRDRIVAQSVPPYIYKARYPMRFFSPRSLDRALSPQYDCEAEYPGFGVTNVLVAPFQVAHYKGSIWRKKIVS